LAEKILLILNCRKDWLSSDLPVSWRSIFYEGFEAWWRTWPSSIFGKIL